MRVCDKCGKVNKGSACNSCATKKLWKDPEYRARRLKQIKEHTSSDAHKQRLAEQNRKNWKDPEWRENRVKYAHDNIDMISQASRNAWKNPEYRKRMEHSDERKAKASEKMKGIFTTEHMSKMGLISSEKRKQNVELRNIRENRIKSLVNKNFTIIGIDRKTTVKCNSCNKVVKRIIGKLKQGCSYCDNKLYAQKTITKMLEKYGAKPYNYRSGNNIRELDIIIPDIGIAIEYNGLYWHRSNTRDKKDHYVKTIWSREIGYRLINIFENQWIYDQRNTVSYLMSEIDSEKLSNCFIDDNKMYCNNTIIAEFKTKGSMLLYIKCFTRYSRKSVIEYIISNLNIDRVIVNLSTIDGYHLEDIGFRLDKIYEPKAWAFKKQNLYKIKHTKVNKISSENYLYDCGYALYIKSL